MNETFTKTMNSTNIFEMKEQETIENVGADDATFYHSICPALDMIEKSPNSTTIQNILNHSQNFVS
jgi:hypothetical protein